MSETPNVPPALDLSEVAQEPAEQSIANEHEIAGDGPDADTGGQVAEDGAQ